MKSSNRLKSMLLLAMTGITLIGCDMSTAKEAVANENKPISEEHKAAIDQAKEVFNNKKLDAKEAQSAVQMMVPDFSSLVEDVGNTVVNIQTKRKVQTRQGGIDIQDFGIDKFFEDFFNFGPFNGSPFGKSPKAPPTQEMATFGSGFIISPDGYIITNSHVVKDSSEIKVLLKDKREFPAKLVGLDEPSDIALLKIEAKDLPAIVTGDATTLKPGQWVAAIGAPFGFDNSVTSGIISATRRSLPGVNYTSFIQTDVAINPGNSGGPLFDLNGRVIGVNSQIFSKSGGFMGISFAVPIDVAMNVATQLKKTGHVERSQIGIIVQGISHDLAKSFGLDKPKGALVVDIRPEVKKANPDINVGDIILEANGQKVDGPSDLPWIVSNVKPDTKIPLKIWRDNKEMTINVTLSKLSLEEAKNPSVRSSPSISGNDGASFRIDKLGIEVAPLSAVKKNPAILQKYGLDPDGLKNFDGLLITGSDNSGRMFGFDPGSIIVKIGTENVNDKASIERAMKKYGKKIPIYMYYGNQFRYIVISVK